jgi:hypothetical protein
MYIQKFYEYINRYNILYHSTSHLHLVSILNDNILKANTRIPVRKLTKQVNILGTSTTRDKKLYFLGIKNPVIVFNDKIYTNNKIFPFNYHSSYYGLNGRNKIEKEEFIIGHVKNVINKIEYVNWLSKTENYNLFRTIFESYNDGVMDSFISLKNNNIPIAVNFNIITDTSNIESYLNDLKEYVDDNDNRLLYNYCFYDNVIQYMRHIADTAIKDYNTILKNKIDFKIEYTDLIYENKTFFYLIFSNFRNSHKYFDMVNNNKQYDTIDELISENNLSLLKYFNI